MTCWLTILENDWPLLVEEHDHCSFPVTGTLDLHGKLTVLVRFRKTLWLGFEKHCSLALNIYLLLMWHKSWTRVSQNNTLLTFGYSLDTSSSRLDEKIPFLFDPSVRSIFLLSRLLLLIHLTSPHCCLNNYYIQQKPPLNKETEIRVVISWFFWWGQADLTAWRLRAFRSDFGGYVHIVKEKPKKGIFM